MRIIKGKIILVLGAAEIYFDERPEQKLASDMLELLSLSLSEAIFAGTPKQIERYKKALKKLT